MSDRDGDGGWQPGCLFALAALVAVFVGFGMVMVACGHALSHVGEGILAPEFPTPLAPIPVPRASCAPLRAVQLTAADAGASWGAVLRNPDDARTWRAFAAR